MMALLFLRGLDDGPSLSEGFDGGPSLSEGAR